IKNCIFQGGKIEYGSIDGIDGTSIKDVELIKLDLTGKINNLDSFQTKYRNVNFRKVKFTGDVSSFVNNQFIGSEFCEIELDENVILFFTGSGFIKMKFRNANLACADFRRVIMSSCIFEKVNLDKSDFAGAKFNPKPGMEVDFTKCGSDLTKIKKFGSKHIKNFLKAKFTREQIGKLKGNGQISEKEAYIYLCELDLANYISSKGFPALEDAVEEDGENKDNTSLGKTILSNKEFMADLIPIFTEKCTSKDLGCGWLVWLVDAMPKKYQKTAIDILVVFEAYIEEKGSSKLYGLAKKLQKDKDYMHKIFQRAVELEETCPLEILELLNEQKTITDKQFEKQICFLFTERLKKIGSSFGEIKEISKDMLLAFFIKYEEYLAPKLIELLKNDDIGIIVFDYLFEEIESKEEYLNDEGILGEYIINGGVKRVFEFKDVVDPEYVKKVCSLITKNKYGDDDYSKIHQVNIEAVMKQFLDVKMKRHRTKIFTEIYGWLIEQELYEDLRQMWGKVDLGENIALFKKLFELLHKSTNKNKKYRDLIIVDTFEKCKENKEFQLLIFSYLFKNNLMSDIDLTAVFGGSNSGIKSLRNIVCSEPQMKKYKGRTKDYFRLLNILNVDLEQKISVFGNNEQELNFDFTEFMVSCLYKMILPRRKIGEEQKPPLISLSNLLRLNELCIEQKKDEALPLFKKAYEWEADNYPSYKVQINQLLPLIIYKPELRNLDLKSFFKLPLDKKNAFWYQECWDFSGIQKTVTDVSSFNKLTPTKLEIYLRAGCSNDACNKKLRDFFLKKTDALKFNDMNHFLIIIRTMDLSVEVKKHMYRLKYPDVDITSDAKFLIACMESMLRKNGITFQDIVELKTTCIGVDTIKELQQNNPPLKTVIFCSDEYNKSNKRIRSFRDEGYFNRYSFLKAWETMGIFKSSDQIIFISRVFYNDSKVQKLARAYFEKNIQNQKGFSKFKKIKSSDDLVKVADYLGYDLAENEDARKVFNLRLKLIESKASRSARKSSRNL
ncbi:pentapeptide repeat-containing protein, partial [Candidatus Margulisiibacteriota bacterium]